MANYGYRLTQVGSWVIINAPWCYALAQQFAELQNVILDDIQPYEAQHGASAFGDLLRAIMTSDNSDKHRMITPVVQNVYANLRTSDDQVVANSIVNGGGMRVPIIELAGPPEMQAEGSLAYDLVFPSSALKLAGKPVISTLVEGCHMVNQVIRIFEARFGLGDVDPIIV